MSAAPFEVGGRFAPPFIILSAERSEYGAEANAVRTNELCQMLDSTTLAFFAVEGSYKGKSEASFLVQVGQDQYWTMNLQRIARYFGQETILQVDERGNAMLIEPNVSGTNTSGADLGQWRSVSDVEVIALDGWTRDRQGTYYAAL